MREMGDWDNKAADGMLPLEMEAEAFGETTPEPQYNKTSSNAAADPAAGEAWRLQQEWVGTRFRIETCIWRTPVPKFRLQR